MKLWGFKDCHLANLGQLTRDIFRAINAQAEIYSVLEIIPNWLKEAHLPELLEVKFIWRLGDEFHKKNLKIYLKKKHLIL